MPTKRMITPAFWQSESIARLTPLQRLLFIGLFSNADDQGRLRGHPAVIRSVVFPYDDISVEQVENDLKAIEGIKAITIYESEDKHCIQVTGWWKYQSPQWAYPSELPAPAGWNDRLRYRENNQVITRNWKGELDIINEEALGKALGKEQTNAKGEAIELGLDIGLDSTSNEVGDKSPTPPTESISESKKPDKKTPLRQPKNPKEPPPPGVVIYREVANRFPHKATWGDIAKKVGDGPTELERWRDTIRAYIGCGWNPNNVKGMLEFFDRREIPGQEFSKARQNGHHKNTATNQTSISGLREKGSDNPVKKRFNPTTGETYWVDIRTNQRVPAPDSA